MFDSRNQNLWLFVSSKDILGAFLDKLIFFFISDEKAKCKFSSAVAVHNINYTSAYWNLLSPEIYCKNGKSLEIRDLGKFFATQFSSFLTYAVWFFHREFLHENAIDIKDDWKIMHLCILYRILILKKYPASWELQSSLIPYCISLIKEFLIG